MTEGDERAGHCRDHPVVARARRGLEKARDKTWDVIVEQMEGLLAEAEQRAA